MDDLFDGELSELLKRHGMGLAADNKEELLHLARAVARNIAHLHGYAHADMVGRVLRGYGIRTLGPAAGSIFKGGDWEWTGDWVKSKRITNHSRMLRVWRLKNGAT